jgi:fermentation-respiration switch protein FrsA (DUF1100 family)
MSRLISVCGACLAFAIILLWLTQRRLIYFPFGDVPAPARMGLFQARPVTFVTGDGVTLNGWFVPTPAPEARDVVAVFNGNAGNRAFRASLAARLAEKGFASLLFDYRGFGDNPGAPSEQGLVLDALAVRHYLESRRDVDPRRIVYFGESLGAAVAVRLAVEHRPRALILRSPFTSLVDMGQLHYPYLPVSWLLRDRFASIDLISRIGCPLLVIAGRNDRIVPLDQSRRLFDAAPKPKRLVIVEGADHNDEALLAGPEVIGAVGEFLRDLE